jgi:hypothetical protein
MSKQVVKRSESTQPGDEAGQEVERNYLVLTTLLSKLLEAKAGGALDGLRNHGPKSNIVSLGWGFVALHDYLNCLGIKLQTLLLVGEELLDIFALITLKLDHLSHFAIDHDGAIASCSRESVPTSARKKSMPRTELLLDHLQDLLLVEFLWQTLDSRQSLTTIALW